MERNNIQQETSRSEVGCQTYLKERRFMSIMSYIRPKEATQIPEPPIARFFFADTRMAWLWLIVRLYVGYEWLSAGWEKLTGYSLFGEAQKGGAWVFAGHDGVAMKGFVMSALAQSSGAHP